MFFENFNLTVNIFQKLMHKNTWEGHFLKIFKKCEVFFTQKVVFFQVFGWCFGLVFLGFELVFWAHDFLATLCKSPIPRACFIDSNYYFKMSSARKIGQFCLLSLKQSSGVSSSSWHGKRYRL